MNSTQIQDELQTLEKEIAKLQNARREIISRGGPYPVEIDRREGDLAERWYALRKLLRGVLLAEYFERMTPEERAIAEAQALGRTL